MTCFPKFLNSSQSSGNDLQALLVNPGCFEFNSEINLSPVNKSLLIILLILK